MNHPLKVFYPYGGIHQLLHWWTHDEQHQIVLARTSKAMETVVKRLVVNQGTHKTYERDIQFKKLFEIDIVGPPAIRCAKAIELQHQKDVDNLVSEVCWSISKLKEAGQPLPHQFTLCQNPVDNKYHFQCEYDAEGNKLPDHCIAGIKLKMPREEFYASYQESWYRWHPKKERVLRAGEPQELYSRAEPATDEESLWVASPDFGHHSHGVALYELNPDMFNSRSELFYFRKLRELDVAPFQKMVVADKKTRLKADSARDAHRKKELELKTQQEITKIYSVFPFTAPSKVK